VEVRPDRTYLAGFGVSAALLAAVAVAFVGVGTFVAFHGWPAAGTSADQAGSSVYVSNGEPANVPSRAAAKALGGATAGVNSSALPSPALIAAAGGAPLPNPGGGLNPGRNGRRGGSTDPRVPALPTPSTVDPFAQVIDTVDGAPDPTDGNRTIGESGLLTPLGPVLQLTGQAAGTLGGLLLGPSPAP
jgi:hypothetical protein